MYDVQGFAFRRCRLCRSPACRRPDATGARRNINSVREAAVLTPGLNISSDGAGRAFVRRFGVAPTQYRSDRLAA